jgi:tRNA C32,U32 (ribose-2'-O)-methylase TrmJ
MNIQKWYELAPNDIQTSEQHKRTEMKIRGLRAIHEDSSEVLIANLAEDIQLKYGNATFPDLQTARSLLVNRSTRTSEEIKVLSELIQKVDKKMEELQ